MSVKTSKALTRGSTNHFSGMYDSECITCIRSQKGTFSCDLELCPNLYIRICFRKGQKEPLC